MRRQGKACEAWTRFWMRWAGLGWFGRLATRCATWTAPPYLARYSLALLNPDGYVAPSATLHHNDVKLGRNVFIGDLVMIYQDTNGEAVQLSDRVRLFEESYFETGEGACIQIGQDSHVHPRCFLSAYKASIVIGKDVLISGQCALYSYDHGLSPDEPIASQPLVSKGDIVIDDGAWVGYGVFISSGVKIGKGAVVGARSVVTKSVPDGAIVAGVPARVVKMRTDHRPSAEVGARRMAVQRCEDSCHEQL